MRLVLLMLSHMIMHRVLSVLDDTTGRTDKLATLIPMIRKGHNGSDRLDR